MHWDLGPSLFSCLPLLWLSWLHCSMSLDCVMFYCLRGCSFRILVSCYCCYFTWQVMNKDSLSKSQGRAKSNESFLPVLWHHVGRKLQQCRRWCYLLESADSHWGSCTGRSKTAQLHLESQLNSRILETAVSMISSNLLLSLHHMMVSSLCFPL